MDVYRKDQLSFVFVKYGGLYYFVIKSPDKYLVSAHSLNYQRCKDDFKGFIGDQYATNIAAYFRSIGNYAKEFQPIILKSQWHPLTKFKYV